MKKTNARKFFALFLVVSVILMSFNFGVSASIEQFRNVIIGNGGSLTIVNDDFTALDHEYDLNSIDRYIDVRFNHTPTIDEDFKDDRVYCYAKT